jgi:cupin 2 domain-containing protein
MKSSLFEGIPGELPEELIEVLAERSHVRIERIVSDGHSSPENFWYDQEDDEWVLLVSGSARLAFDDETIELKSGDHLLIPAHKRHRVEATSEAERTIWLAVHF